MKLDTPCCISVTFSRGLPLDDCLSFFECQWDVDPAYLVSTLHLKIKVEGKDMGYDILKFND